MLGILMLNPCSGKLVHQHAWCTNMTTLFSIMVDHSMASNLYSGDPLIRRGHASRSVAFEIPGYSSLQGENCDMWYVDLPKSLKHIKTHPSLPLLKNQFRLERILNATQCKFNMFDIWFVFSGELIWNHSASFSNQVWCMSISGHTRQVTEAQLHSLCIIFNGDLKQKSSMLEL